MYSDHYSSVMYGGAPDECNYHWPQKLVDGYCPRKGCPESREQIEKTETITKQLTN